MKSIFKYLPVLALAIAATSCDDLIEDKSVIDAKYATELPTISLQNITVVDYSTIEVSYTASSVNGMASAGVQVATDASFTNPSWLEIADFSASGTSVVNGLLPETQYYARLYFATNDGTTFSDSKEFTTPAVPLTSALLVGKTYKASAVADYWGDTFDYNVTINAVEGSDYKVYVNNIEPYLAENGYTFEKNGTNHYEGELDPESGIITVAMGQLAGYKQVTLYAFDAESIEDAEGYDDLYIQVNDYGQSLTILNGYGFRNGSGWWEIFDAPITLK